MKKCHICKTNSARPRQSKCKPCHAEYNRTREKIKKQNRYQEMYLKGNQNVIACPCGDYFIKKYYGDNELCRACQKSK